MICVFQTLLCMRASSFLKPVCACMLSRFSLVRLFVTLWTLTRQTPLSMGFSKQEYWSGLPCLPPGDLPSPGIEPTSITSPALAGKSFTTSATWEALLKSVAHLLSWLSSNQAWFSYPCLAHSLAAMHVGFFCAALSPVAHPSQCNCAKVSL